MNLFRRHTLEDILSDHADALNRDQDNTDQLLRKFEKRWPELALLLVLARSLQQAMGRREAPPSLTSARFLRAAEHGRSPATQNSRRRWVMIGGITSVIATTAGVIAWFYWRTGEDGEPTASSTTSAA